MLIAITRDVSPSIANCELTFVDRQTIDQDVASTQLENYRGALEKCGVVVRRLPADSRYPDSCFVEDTAIVVDELAVIASMGAASRRGETAAIEAELSPYREIERITLPATLDGGDVVRLGRHILVGHSTRTNEAGIQELARILERRGYRVIPVRTNGSLHFKSACTAIDDETLLVNPDWIRVDDLDGFRMIFTPDEEPAAANVLRVRQTLFVQAGFHRTIQLLEGVHSKVEVLDTSELRKAEGALTCLSIVFRVTESQPGS
jgi:dimethylargininase